MGLQTLLEKRMEFTNKDIFVILPLNTFLFYEIMNYIISIILIFFEYCISIIARINGKMLSSLR